jgi:hypothetical protein
MAKPKTNRIFQLKVTLRDTKPPIWRRLEVDAEISLFRLHDVLQAAMGWTDSHLHQFEARKVLYGLPDPEFDFPRKDERTTRLGAVLQLPKDRMIYEYDFGDGWLHDVVLEKVLDPNPDTRYPICTDGRRATPPEDCGGIGGFYNLLEIVGNPSHPERPEMIEWIGAEFDAEAFDIEEINAALRSSGGAGRR